MMQQAYFEDFKMGDRITTPARTITETDIVQFAALTGDWHPLHTNAEFAKQTIFGERIAHGLLILSIGGGLMFQVQSATSLLKSAIALSGIDKIRFVAPIKIGDTIHVEGEVVNSSVVNGERGLISISQRIKNQHGQEVLTFTMKVIVGRRPQTADEYDG